MRGNLRIHLTVLDPTEVVTQLIMQIQKRFSGVRWFVEGDIEGFFDNIDHHILINLLRENIEDEKFINLIWKFLKAGYIKDWKWHKSYSGTPQGGIISPILSNIYLNKLDKFMKEYKETFDKGKKRRHSNEYVNVATLIRHYRRRIDVVGKETEKGIEYLQKLKELETKLRNIPSKDEMDKNFRRLLYTRYADDFVVGVIGAKRRRRENKRRLNSVCKNKVKSSIITRKNNHNKFCGKRKISWLRYNY